MSKILGQLRELRINVLLQFLARLGQLLLELQSAGDLPGVFDQRQVVRPFRAREHAVEAVVVLLRDRVVLVVVAARARDRQAQKPACGRVNLIVDLIVQVVVEEPPQGQKTQRSQSPHRQFWFDQIGRQLILHELIERQVLIERADDVVPVSVGVWPQRIFAIDQHKVFCVRVACHVQPVPAPTFAVAR